MAVMAQVPTFLIFLLPILICSSKVSKKESSIFWQLHLRDYFITSPTLSDESKCSERYRSIKVFILALEYSASSGPPWPSKTLTVQALMALSCVYASVSSQGWLASYCKDLMRLVILFFCSWLYAVKREWVLGSYTFPLFYSSVYSIGNLTKGSMQSLQLICRMASFILSLAEEKGAARASLKSSEDLSVWGCRILLVVLRVGMMSLSNDNEFIYYYRIFKVKTIRFYSTHAPYLYFF